MGSKSKKTKNESVCHVHPRYIWMLMFKPILVLLLILIIINFVYTYTNAQNIITIPFVFNQWFITPLIIILILIPFYIWAWLKYITFIYIIKKDELTIRRGVIIKRHNSIPYDKIRNVQRIQSLLERIFGLCTISIETSLVTLEFPHVKIPGMLNSKELPELILKKTHVDQEAEVTLANTMREILSQLKKLNKQEK